MPFAGLGLHVLIAVFFAVHAVRTGQGRYWLFVLFAFPLLGSAVYALAVLLPQARHSPQGQQVVHGMRRLLDPDRELRQAQETLDVAATPDNRLRLADALLGAGRASEAVVQYQGVLTGIYAQDARIQVHLARALLEAGRADAARDLLEQVIRENPGLKSPEGHLTYARAVAALGDKAKAREEFETLVGYFAGLEARARYAGVLLEWGERERASALVEQSLKQAKRMPGYARGLNKPWLAELKRIEGRLRS